jgi:hypothetical protein
MSGLSSVQRCAGRAGVGHALGHNAGHDTSKVVGGGELHLHRAATLPYIRDARVPVSVAVTGAEHGRVWKDVRIRSCCTTISVTCSVAITSGRSVVFSDACFGVGVRREARRLMKLFIVCPQGCVAQGAALTDV